MTKPSPDLPVLLEAIRANPARGFNWLALAAWLCTNGRHDEADAVRVFWPKLSAHVQAGQSVHMAKRPVARDPIQWGWQARHVAMLKRDRDQVWPRVEATTCVVAG